MDLTTNQIIAAVVSSMVILKMVIMFFLPNASFKKFLSIYDNININIVYYIYSIIGSLVFYYIYSSSNFSLSDILAISFPILLIVGGAMLKMIGNEKISKIFNKYQNFNELFKDLWFYILLWIMVAIMTLKEIFF
mgnify:FL=1|tara:strand:- start:16 stop:420 length:405 start_codon:yes stop_codon:yes gene_type:complete